jgi:maltooligosyltrehalose synthase
VFADALKRRGLGLPIDVVPNHMGIALARNRWWRDVLENGPSSRDAAASDIDWRPVKPERHDRVLLPVLGDQYGAVLDRGELRLGLADGLFELAYDDGRHRERPRRRRHPRGVCAGRLPRGAAGTGRMRAPSDPSGPGPASRGGAIVVR